MFPTTFPAVPLTSTAASAERVGWASPSKCSAKPSCSSSPSTESCSEWHWLRAGIYLHQKGSSEPCLHHRSVREWLPGAPLVWGTLRLEWNKELEVNTQHLLESARGLLQVQFLSLQSWFGVAQMARGAGSCAFGNARSASGGMWLWHEC